MKLWCIYFIARLVVAFGKIRYDGYQLYRVVPKDVADLNILKNIRHYEDYSFWNELSLQVPTDVMVSPGKMKEFEKLVNVSKMNFEITMDDVQKYIDSENPNINFRGNFDWKAYHRLDVIYNWMDSLAAEYPKIVTKVVGGHSFEDREIRGIKLSYKDGNPGIFLEGGIHAREWISPAVVTYVLNELITSEDPAVRHTAESYDWYIFPIFNPDGYEYAHTVDRFWRKTRKPYTKECFGADPNRNWDFHWAEGGEASEPPCGITFPGDKPFSENETKSMSEYITSIKNKIFAYVGFHSYSQYLLLPYAYTNAKLENFPELLQIGQFSAKALEKRYGTRYKVGNVVDILTIVRGSSMDWVRGTLRIPIVFTYELRDRGQYGFLLPADQIIPTGQETLDSLVAMFQEADRHFYGRCGRPIDAPIFVCNMTLF